MNHPESAAGVLFRHWVRANGHKLQSGSYEIKDSRGKSSISYTEIGQEQIDHALANKGPKGNLTRVASGTIGAADYHFYRNATAWFVIRYPKSMEIIGVDALLLEKERSLRRSLTSARAGEISTITVKL